MQDKIMQAVSYDTIIKTILNSDPKEDWKYSSYFYSNQHFGCYFYAPDVNLRFEEELDNNGCSVDTDFSEDWTGKFADPNAKTYGYGLYYASTLIKTFPLISVDGARAHLPMPEAHTTNVPRLNYRVAQIHMAQTHNGLIMLEEYMERAGLKVSPE